jgi:ATP-dependent helicase YprA (DUF1998 family)
MQESSRYKTTTRKASCIILVRIRLLFQATNKCNMFDRIILYDANGNGNGITRQAFQFIDSLVNQALEAIESCSCEEGCPECKLCLF